MVSIKTMLKKVEEAYPHLGWKGGDGSFDCWRDDDKIYIAVETQKKKLRKETIEKLELLFGGEVEFFDEGYTGRPYIIVLIEKRGVR
jgi:hypothetical protein